MLQNEEKAVTPRIVDAIRFSTKKDNAQNTMPATRNIHQHFVPRYYSALMTIGWKTPIIKNVARPTIIPVKFINTNFYSSV